MTKIRFLLDTNILSEPLRPRPNSDVVRMLQQQEGAIATATVVFHELLFGCYRLPIASNKRKIIEIYLQREFNYRGAIVPVIDLCQLIRGTSSQAYLSTRVFIVSYPAQEENKLKYVGLMAERVIKTVKKSANEFLASGIQTSEAPYLGKMIMDEKGMIQHINLEQLLSIFKQISLLEAGV